jgi:dTMP kinase
MARGRLIVLEGSEAAGKKTQALLLVDRLVRAGKRAEYVHFPTYESTRFGDLIRRYLRGEFGPKESIPPEVGCLLYALDRYQFKEAFAQKLARGAWLVADRYTPSNLFQAAKAASDQERLAIAEWLSQVEARLPQPDLVVVFDAPPAFSHRSAERRAPADIHESDVRYLARVRALYLQVAKRMRWPVLSVARGGEFRPREDIHADVWRLLREKKLL